MIFYYLLAGHLVGDYELQTNKIAKKKMEGLKWLLLHTIIVSVSMLFFSLPYGLKSIFLVLINGITHLFIDYFKSKFKSTTPVVNFIYYLADQFCHITVIYFISLFPNSQSKEIVDSDYIYFLISFLFILSFASVTIQFMLKIIYNMDYKSFYINNEKSVGNINRIIFFITIVLGYYFSAFYLLLLPLAIICIFIYYRVKLSEWMPARYFTSKLLLEMLFAAGGVLIFELLEG
jgi:hypothetical protein